MAAKTSAIESSPGALALARSPIGLVLLGHGALAFALFISNGHDRIDALVLVILALLLWVAALVAVARGARTAPGEGESLLFALTAGGAALAFVRPPGLFIESPLGPFHALSAAVLALVASYAVDVVTDRRLPASVAWTRRALLVALGIAIGAWIIRAAPNPQIDLYPEHQQAAAVMLSGKSIYTPGVLHVPVTNGVQVAWVDEYVYLPFGAVLSTVGYALTHDCRATDLAGQVIGACLLWAAARRCLPLGRRDRAWPDLLAASLLFHPRGWFVLEETWTEPMALPFLGAFVLAVLGRRWIAASVALGLVCAVKQHLVLYVPFAAMIPGMGLQGAVLAGVTAAVTLVPFALPSVHDFYRGVLGLHLTGPFRGDSLSIPGEVSSAGVILPSWLGFLSALVPVASIPKIPRRLGPLLLGASLCFGLFYVMGRQAFCNYYYLLDATVLFAAATLSERPATSEA